MTALNDSARTFVFRVDASRQIGTGHVMRCLTLANALSSRGMKCHFVCRLHDGNLVQRIESHGHMVHYLPKGLDTQCDRSFVVDTEHDPAHADWLGVPWQVDAEQSSRILSTLKPDWLVVDHYALDARWENLAAPEDCRVFVIDDLADRPHSADLLLDQNLGRSFLDYAHLVPEESLVMAGPSYALLRPEFSKWRGYSLSRRQKPQIEQLLVSLGGVDINNTTSLVLDSLSQCSLPRYLKISVVMGASSPWLDEVRDKAKNMPCTTEVVVDVEDMAVRMAEADLAIGAAGSTSWERCCLGLPAIMLILADNQRSIARCLHKAKAAICVGDYNIPGCSSKLRNVLGTLLADSSSLATMANHAASLTDGLGVNALVNCLIED